jgi:hypothetical protein
MRQVGIIFQTAALLHLSEDHQQANDNPSKHNPRHPETTKEGTPQSGSYLAMKKKKMVHRLLIPLARATSVHHNNMSLLEIIEGQDLG